MELVGEQKQMVALQRIHAHLADNGVFICTLHNPAQRIRLATGEKVFRGGFALPDEQTLVLHSEEHVDSENSLIKGTQFFSIYNKQGELLIERQLKITFSLIDAPRFEHLAEGAGFSVQKVCGDYNRGEFNAQKSPFMIYYLGR